MKELNRSLRNTFFALALLSTFFASAHDFEVDGIYYSRISGTEVSVTYRGNSYNSYSNEYTGDVVIASTVSYNSVEYSVTAIASSAFSGCSGLTSVSMPNSVTTIGSSAFSGCSRLTAVTIPNSVTTIGSSAFFGCSGLTSVNITDIGAWCNISFVSAVSNPLGYAHNLYLNGEKIENLVIPETIEAIKAYTFDSYTGLTTVTIPNTVTSIGSSAFRGCSGLTAVTIPGSVRTIGNYAFDGCSSIKEITIEDGDETLSLGYNVSNNGLFYDSPFEKLYLGRNLSYATGSYYGYSPFYNKTSLTELTIGSSVTELSDYSFSGCSGLTAVTIPNSVKKIGNSAFEACSAIKEIRTKSYNIDGLADSGLSAENIRAIITPDQLNEDVADKISQTGLNYFNNLVVEADGVELAIVTAPETLDITNCVIKNAIMQLVPCGEEVIAKADRFSVSEAYFMGTNVLDELRGEGLTFTPSSEWKDNIFEIYNGTISVELDAMPEMKYGDADVDLSNYAPSYYAFEYESSDETVVEIDGATMRVVGAGTATVTAKIPAEYSNIVIDNPAREIIVAKAGLSVTVADITITQGQPLPEFTYIVSGFVNGDTADDIAEMPRAVCDVTEDSAPGEYTVEFTEGSDRNYEITTKAATVTVIAPTILELSELPEVKYGADAIDLSQYAPEDYELEYETPDNDVVEISGSTMRIIGAGKATVIAKLPAQYSDVRIDNPAREIIVAKADLSVTVADITITQGQPLPEFTYIVSGFVNGDTVDDIAEMPRAVCDVTEDSAPGEYTVEFTEGSDRNYEITTKAATVTVTAVEPPVSNIDDIAADKDGEIEVYDMKGIHLYTGPRSEARLAKGFYLVRRGAAVTKVYVE